MVPIDNGLINRMEIAMPDELNFDPSSDRRKPPDG